MDLFRREDAHTRPNRERQRVGRPRVDLDDPASGFEDDPGMERLVGQIGDDDLADRRPQLGQDAREQVVRERPLGGEPLQLMAIAFASHGPIQMAGSAGAPGP